MELKQRLTHARPLILDGATGSELTRRGVDTSLPLWSAPALLEAPETVKAIHIDYVAAGADMITANTFRTHRRSMAKGGYEERARELTHLAVDLVREAIDEGLARRARGDEGETVLVAGSMAPLEDCYSPELVPSREMCAAEHCLMARWLVEAGADLLLIETMNCVREALAAAQAAKATGRPFIVSWVCGKDGRLLSGESILEGAGTIRPYGPVALGVNCTALGLLHRPLAELRKACGLPLLASANMGHPDDHRGWADDDPSSPVAYAQKGLEWVELGARVVGGCCGTGPAHIKALRKMIKNTFVDD